MKKTFIINAKRLLAVLPLMLFALAASAQAGGGESAAERSTSVFAERLMGELSVGVGTRCNDVTPLEFSGKLGYRFIPRMYAFVHAGGLYGMYGKDSGQRYTKSAHLGGGLGYTLFQGTRARPCSLTCAARWPRALATPTGSTCCMTRPWCSASGEA